MFSLTFYGVNGHKWVEDLLISLPGGAIGFLIVVNAIVFVLAFFLDFFELAFIVIPLLGPAAEHLGIDLIWFGVIMGVNMQTSFMHPPFGFALFYLRSVAAKSLPRPAQRPRMEPVTTGQIYWGAVPFVCIQLVMVGLVILFPSWSCTTKAPAPASARTPSSSSTCPRWTWRRSISASAAAAAYPGWSHPQAAPCPDWSRPRRCRAWSRRTSRHPCPGLSRRRHCRGWSRRRRDSRPPTDQPAARAHSGLGSGLEVPCGTDRSQYFAWLRNLG